MTAHFPGSEGGRGDREFRRFLDIAIGSACELECEAILSYDLAFITETAQEQLRDGLLQIKRMLGGLLARLGWGRIPDVARRTTASQDKPEPAAGGG
jgi:hypothetical protein